MTAEERKEYVEFRLETANKTYDAAKHLFENGYYNSCINRLYYASFYAVNALLVFHEIKLKKHSTAISQFSLRFIKTGILDLKYGQLYNTLFDLRQKGDYENLYFFSKENVEPYIKEVKNFIIEIEKLLGLD
jgi:uncharacterized protein (UPF0332 family)